MIEMLWVYGENSGNLFLLDVLLIGVLQEQV